MCRPVSAAIIVVLFASASPAGAQYAEPPTEAVQVVSVSMPRDDSLPRSGIARTSSVRVMTGPTARLSSTDPAAGISAALEAGRGAAGARATAAWIAVGSEHGVAQYTGEIWVAFELPLPQLRPSLGAGGGLARVGLADDAPNAPKSADLGVGVLRGGLTYLVPARGADARLSLDLSGVVPALRASNVPEVGPWLIAAASVAVGF